MGPSAEEATIAADNMRSEAVHIDRAGNSGSQGRDVRNDRSDYQLDSTTQG